MTSMIAKYSFENLLSPCVSFTCSVNSSSVPEKHPQTIFNLLLSSLKTVVILFVLPND